MELLGGLTAQDFLREYWQKKTISHPPGLSRIRVSGFGR